MKLTPGTTINSGDTVTRQTIFDLIGSASIDGVVADTDLSDGTPQNVSQSGPPSAPGPGSMWWDKTNQVMRVWYDEIDGTGVSLWLAAGPDVFEIEAIASEPIPFGACVQCDLAAGHKWMKLPPSGSDLVVMGHTAARVEPLRVVGFNNDAQANNYVPDSAGYSNSMPTTASGAWFRLTVSGVVWAWHPLNRNQGGTWIAAGQSVTDSLALVSGTVFSTAPGGFTSPRGYDLANSKGGLIFEEVFAAVQDGSPSIICLTGHRAIATNSADVYSRAFFFCPRMGRQSNA